MTSATCEPASERRAPSHGGGAAVGAYRDGGAVREDPPHELEERDHVVVEVIARLGATIVHAAHLAPGEHFTVVTADAPDGRPSFAESALAPAGLFAWCAAVLTTCYGAGVGATGHTMVVSAALVVVALTARWRRARARRRRAADPTRLLVDDGVLGPGVCRTPLVVARPHGPAVRLRASAGDEVEGDGVARGAAAWLASGEGHRPAEAPEAVEVALRPGRRARLRVGALTITARLRARARPVPRVVRREAVTASVGLACATAATLALGAFGRHLAIEASLLQYLEGGADEDRLVTGCTYGADRPAPRLLSPSRPAPSTHLPARVGDPRARPALAPPGGRPFGEDFLENDPPRDPPDAFTGLSCGCDPPPHGRRELDRWDRSAAPTASPHVRARVVGAVHGPVDRDALEEPLAELASRVERCYRRMMLGSARRSAVSVSVRVGFTARGAVTVLPSGAPASWRARRGASSPLLLCTTCALRQTRVPASERGASRATIRVSAARW